MQLVVLVLKLGVVDPAVVSCLMKKPYERENIVTTLNCCFALPEAYLEETDGLITWYSKNSLLGRYINEVGEEQRNGPSIFGSKVNVRGH